MKLYSPHHFKKLNESVFDEMSDMVKSVLDDEVVLTNKGLSTLDGISELQYDIINGSCYVNINDLTDLEGSPSIVNKVFCCTENHLTTLEGGPKEVGGHFQCQLNKLTDLKGSPRIVKKDFECHDNPLTSLEGHPDEVFGDFYLEQSEFINDDVIENLKRNCKIHGDVILVN
jgi:hypothetical protein